MATLLRESRSRAPAPVEKRGSAAGPILLFGALGALGFGAWELLRHKGGACPNFTVGASPECGTEVPTPTFSLAPSGAGVAVSWTRPATPASSPLAGRPVAIDIWRIDCGAAGWGTSARIVTGLDTTPGAAPSSGTYDDLGVLAGEKHAYVVVTVIADPTAPGGYRGCFPPAQYITT